MSSENIPLLQVTLPPRLSQLLKAVLPAFEQTDNTLLARPMGISVENCKIAYSLGQSLLKGESLMLEGFQVEALILMLSFAERELCSEINLQMQDLQKKMASIVIARSSKEISRLASELPKEAEKAMRNLKSVIKNRGELLDECQAFIKKLKASQK